jgi:chromosomal replication initiation ATPase DnaA
MPKLTKQHYEWLSTDIAKMINPSDRRAFVEAVVRFDTNTTFIRKRFEDSMMKTIEDIWADNKAEEISPELYKFYDSGWRAT